MVNHAGGINGHPVKLYIQDDGGDPSKEKQYVQDMVENKHVLAIVYFDGSGSSTLGNIEPYLRQKGIPVIGGAIYEALWNQSPVVFPDTMSADTSFYSVDQTAATTAKHSLYVLYCAEAGACKASADGEAKYAAVNHITIAGSEQISIAQPDYTSECLNAQNSHADMLTVGADTNTVQRVANSCARVGYHPIFVQQGASITDDLKSNRNLDGLVGAQSVFPWFASDTPARAEFRAALRTYAPGTDPSPSSAAAWAAGKEFERAARGIAAGSTPTTQAVLAGLWSMHGETLGGLTPPLTFHRGQPAPDAKCFFGVVLRQGRWQELQHAMLCRP